MGEKVILQVPRLPLCCMLDAFQGDVKQWKFIVSGSWSLSLTSTCVAETFSVLILQLGVCRSFIISCKNGQDTVESSFGASRQFCATLLKSAVPGMDVVAGS